MDGNFSMSPEVILLTIVLLVVLYLLSKLWQTQLEPNIRVIGKQNKLKIFNKFIIEYLGFDVYQNFV